MFPIYSHLCEKLKRKEKREKNKMRKRLALVLAATMALSVFAMGCGSSEETTNETTTKAATTAPVETTTAPAEETTTAPAEETTDAPAAEVTDVFGLEDKSQAWWTEFSEYYKYTGDFKATFEIAVDGGAGNWNSFVTAIATTERDTEGYSEYAVVRPDCWGWGGGDNKSLAGNDIVYTKSFESFDTLDPTFAATANNGVITVTIERVGTTVTFTYDIVGNNGATLQTTAAVTDNFADDLVFFFCADGSYCTIKSVK